MLPVDQAWEYFNNNDRQLQDKVIQKEINNNICPKCSPIYISTKTKLAYLNQTIDLQKIFWQLPIMAYQTQKSGIIKKQIKINCTTNEEVQALEEKITNIEEKGFCITVDTIKKVKKSRNIKFKDTRKINIGLAKKDVKCFKKIKKGAFYNCFVLILRVKFEGNFIEVHTKVFNTGKLEIPGIHDDKILTITLEQLLKSLQPFINNQLLVKENSIENVLINSNFSCNYFVNRDKMFKELKYTYKLHVIYDACSYPGIQCKFYYNKNNSKNNGVCNCKTKCTKKGTGDGEGNCKEISFMIFRTGSILVVGNCTEEILYIIYNFLKQIFADLYSTVMIPGLGPTKENKQRRIRKKKILIRK